MHCTVRRGIAVQGDRLRRTQLAPDRFAEKGLGGSDITPGAQPEVDGLTRPVCRATIKMRKRDNQDEKAF
jgi:hypothetical protein